MFITRLSFWILFNSRSPCFIVAYRKKQTNKIKQKDSFKMTTEGDKILNWLFNTLLVISIQFLLVIYLFYTTEWAWEFRKIMITQGKSYIWCTTVVLWKKYRNSRWEFIFWYKNLKGQKQWSYLVLPVLVIRPEKKQSHHFNT